MPSTVHYLCKVEHLFGDIWNVVASIASPYALTGVSPIPDPAASARVSDVHLIAPESVRDLLFEDIDPASERRHLSCKSSCPGTCNVNHVKDLDSSCSDFKEYKIDWDGDTSRFKWGVGNTLPRDLPLYIQRGVLMNNLCDWSAFALGASLEEVVNLIDPKAEVLWLQVISRRRIQFAQPRSPGSSESRYIATTPSVLFIRSLHAGNFVLDPTGEQFGHPPEHRFLAWCDYNRHYFLSTEKSIGEKVCFTEHKLEQAVDWKANPECGYWREARDAVDKGVEGWLRNICAGGLSLQEGLDDQYRRSAEAATLMEEVAKLMHAVQKRSAC